MIGGLTPEVVAAWLIDIRRHARLAEERRRFAKYNTGTISEAACVYLRAITTVNAPSVAIEVGTFIGTSAMAIQAARVYTCDKSNDCGPRDKRIVCHPVTSSTRMLIDLLRKGIRAEFFFFDGRIKEKDLDLILELSAPDAVYAFDDYDGNEKGVINVGRLGPRLPPYYQLIPPPGKIAGADGTTTIALLQPPLGGHA